MSEARFTKTPWTVYITNCNVMVKIKNGFGLIVGIFNNEENRANAHLITAAPEMYAMLEDLAQDYQCGCGYKSCRIERTRKEIDALLTEARGEKL